MTEQVACAQCGTAAEVATPPGWTLQTSDRRRGVEWLCPECTRQNLRSIEGRLDSHWW